MDPVAVGALGELIATAVAAAAGKSWAKIRPNPEAKAVRRAVERALVAAFRDASRDEVAAGDDWVAEVAGVWEPAFTMEVVNALVGCLARPTKAQDEFAVLAVRALGDSGCDIAELDRTFWIEQFLCVLPQLMFDQLRLAALSSDSSVRNLVGHLLDQRAEFRTTGAQVTVATPRQFREDVIGLLQRLDEEARTGRLPPYLPRGADVSRLARTVRVRRGVRTGVRSEEVAESAARWAYLLPVERSEDAEDGELVRPWPEVAAAHRRLVVLGDPGLGKSWLIRTETCRLCLEALGAAARGEDLGAVMIPVPVRCDQLLACGGQSLAESAARYLVSQQLLPSRSESRLRARLDDGWTVFLLDALDELTTTEEYGRLKELLRSWQAQVGDRAWFVLTSRIAGYRGPPAADACEVELQALTPGDVSAAVTAWQLQPPVAAQVLARVKDPAVAGMTRIPLLLGLLCSLAAELPGQQLPVTRGELYERVLRWFLTQTHRADERPHQPELLAEEVDALLDTVAPVAFHFATWAARWTDLMPADQLRAAIRFAGAAFTERSVPASDIVQELSIGAAILAPAGNQSAGRRPSYLFLHRTIAEYLVARHLATLPAADWLAVVDQHLWFNPDWAEVIPLLGGQLDQSSACQLVELLLGQADDPFHHALLAALRVVAERPDPDHLLPSGLQRQMADRALGLIANPVTRLAVTPVLAAAPRLPSLIVQGLLARLDDPDQDVWHAVVRILTNQQGPVVTAGLLARLNRPAAGVSMTVVRMLADRPDPKVTAALLACLNDPDWEVYRAVGAALAGRKDSEVTRALLARLNDSDVNVRRAAVDALAGQEGSEVTRALLAHLNDSYIYVRTSAVDALAGRDDPQVTDALLAVLEDRYRDRYQDHDLRQAAAKALAAQDTPEVTGALMARLEHANEQVRLAVVNALAGKNTRTVTDALLARLGDPHWWVRTETVRALAGQDGPDVTQALLPRLEDPDRSVRLAAVEAVVRRDGPAVTEALLARMEDTDWEIRKAAARALAGRDGARITQALLASSADRVAAVQDMAKKVLAGRSGREVTTAALACLEDFRPRVQARAARALVGRDGAGVTEALLARLDDPDLEVRLALLAALAGRDSAVVTEALLARLEDKHWTMRATAAEALARQSGPAVTAELSACLDDVVGAVRKAAARALAGREGPAAIGALLAHRYNRDPDTRWAVLEALACHYAPEIAEVLLSARTDWQTRRAAVLALTSGTAPAVPAALPILLDHPDASVRQVAVKALAGREGSEVTGALLARLADSDGHVRNAAVKALAGRNAPEVSDALVAHLDDQDRNVQKAAADALASRDTATDLLALARQLRTFNLETLPIVYQTAQRMAARVYQQLPAGSQSHVRAQLGWLTKTLDRPKPHERPRLRRDVGKA